MDHIDPSGSVLCDNSFATEVRKESGVQFNRCYQCLTCTLGCPLRFAMDIPPNEIVRLAQLGMKDDILNSSTIWVCASCDDVPQPYYRRQLLRPDPVPVRNPRPDYNPTYYVLDENGVQRIVTQDDEPIIQES